MLIWLEFIAALAAAKVNNESLKNLETIQNSTSNTHNDNTDYQNTLPESSNSQLSTLTPESISDPTSPPIVLTIQLTPQSNYFQMFPQYL